MENKENIFDISKYINKEEYEQAWEELKEIYTLGEVLLRMIKDSEVWIDSEFRTGQAIYIDGLVSYKNNQEKDCINKLIKKYRGK